MRLAFCLFYRRASFASAQPAIHGVLTEEIQEAIVPAVNR